MAARNGSNGNGKLSLITASAATCGVVLAVVAYLGSLSLDPMREAVKELKEISKLQIQSTIQGAISNAEHGEKIKSLEEKSTLATAKIKELDDKVVPRGEHTEKWKANDQAFVNIQKQIDDIRKDVGSTYSLGDKIKEMQEQINRLLQLDKPKSEK